MANSRSWDVKAICLSVLSVTGALCILLSISSPRTGPRFQERKTGQAFGQTATLVIEDERPRLTTPTLVIERGMDNLKMQAQTIHHLVLQMVNSERYSSNDIARVMKAHRLAISLTGHWYRGQGRPLDAHLIGTASLAVTFGQPIQVVLIMMTHSLALFSEVHQNGRFVKPTHDVLDKILRSSGVGYTEEAIDVVLHWKLDKKHSGINVDPALLGSSSLAADMVVLEALNYLDELLDLYLVGFELTPSPISYGNLQLVGAESLADAIEAARLNLAEIYDQHPGIWKSVAFHDPLPGRPFGSWRVDISKAGIVDDKARTPMSIELPYEPSIPVNCTDSVPPKRKSVFCTGTARWTKEKAA